MLGATGRDVRVWRSSHLRSLSAQPKTGRDAGDDAGSGTRAGRATRSSSAKKQEPR